MRRRICAAVASLFLGTVVATAQSSTEAASDEDVANTPATPALVDKPLRLTTPKELSVGTAPAPQTLYAGETTSASRGSTVSNLLIGIGVALLALAGWRTLRSRWKNEHQENR